MNLTALRATVAMGFCMGLVVVLALVGCSGSGAKAVNPGIARFVGTWRAEGSGQGAMLRVESDQRAVLTIGRSGDKPEQINGRCNPGSDTLTFIEDGGPRSANRVILFATRPDGSLAATLDGVPIRLRRS